MKSPADKNPQVNNQQIVEDDDDVSPRHWPVQIKTRFFIFIFRMLLICFI